MRNRFPEKFLPCGKLLACVVFSGISLIAFADTYTDAEIAYRNGQYSKAFHFFQLAAKEGNKDALYNLGHMHLQGKGTQQNLTEARNCFLQAAAKSRPGRPVPAGQFVLLWIRHPKRLPNGIQVVYESGRTTLYACTVRAGTLHEEGCGVSKNPYKATMRFRQAAERGDARAQYQIGYRYFTGYGSRRDRDKAYEWLARAAEQNNQTALDFLEKYFRTRQNGKETYPVNDS